MSTTLKISYGDKSSVEAAVDADSSLVVNGAPLGGLGDKQDFTQAFPLKGAMKVELVGAPLEPRRHPSGQNQRSLNHG